MIYLNKAFKFNNKINIKSKVKFKNPKSSLNYQQKYYKNRIFNGIAIGMKIYKCKELYIQ